MKEAQILSAERHRVIPSVNITDTDVLFRPNPAGRLAKKKGDE